MINESNIVREYKSFYNMASNIEQDISNMLYLIGKDTINVSVTEWAMDNHLRRDKVTLAINDDHVLQVVYKGHTIEWSMYEMQLFLLEFGDQIISELEKFLKVCVKEFNRCLKEREVVKSKIENETNNGMK